MTRRQRRLSVIAGLGAVVIVAFGLILFALRDQIVFFYSPTEIHEKAIAVGTPVRLGGLVKAGSWTHQGDQNAFTVTDGTTDLTTHFTGILPDLFREGQSIVATGALKDGHFVATEVLAKHDETYMPKEVKDAIDKAKQAHADKPAG